MSQPGRCIFSIAPFVSSGDEATNQTQHWLAYQLALRDAAIGAGHEMTILARQGIAMASGGVDSCLTGSDPAALLDSVARVLSASGHSPEPRTVLFYEGGLPYLEAMAKLAARFPDDRFLFNLFQYDRFLNTPTSGAAPKILSYYFASDFHGSIARKMGELSAIPFPGNLVVTAETHQRALLASALGIPVVGAWPVYSLLHDRGPARYESRKGIFRVLIPLSGWQLSDTVVFQISAVIAQVAAIAGGEVEYRWLITGDYSLDRSVERYLRVFRSVGAEVSGASRSRDGYAAIYDSVEIVWLPNPGTYYTQSSGKALDALSRGVPILSPYGSYGPREQERWVPGFPGYGSISEAIEVLLQLPFVVPSFRASLLARNAEIREEYSPESSLQRLLSLTTPSAPGGPTGSAEAFERPGAGSVLSAGTGDATPGIGAAGITPIRPLRVSPSRVRRIRTRMATAALASRAWTLFLRIRWGRFIGW